MTARLPLIDPARATGPEKALLDAVKAKMGLVPNLTRALANSPAALKSYLDFSGALEVIWEVVRDLNTYFTLMEGAIRAHAGQTIEKRLHQVAQAPGLGSELNSSPACAGCVIQYWMMRAFGSCALSKIRPPPCSTPLVALPARRAA